MHLHIIAAGRQLTVQTKEEAPLAQAVDEAFGFHKSVRGEGMAAATPDGNRVDLAKTPEENGLVGDEVIIVGYVEQLPVRAEPEPPAEAPPAPTPARAEKGGKGKKSQPKNSVTVTSPPIQSSAKAINWAALRRGRDSR